MNNSASAMQPFDLRTDASSLAAALALNGAVAQMTSPLDAARLRQLLAWSELAPAVRDAEGRLAGFLIAMKAGSPYDSPNYRWFSDRLQAFAYVDRVVIAPSAQGLGLARGLYARLADHARRLGLGPIVCEVNLVPPNPGSDAFHAALRFEEMGRGTPGPGKTVRYLIRRDGA